MNTVSIGSGTRNGSPYISEFGSSIASPTPWTMGCERLIAQSRSRSPASRQRSAQGAPMSRLKGFEKCPEWSTIRPIPDGRGARPLNGRVLHRAVQLVPPPEQHVRRVEPRLAQPLLRLVQRRARRLDPVLRQGLGDGRVDALGIDLPHHLVLALMRELVPDDGADHGLLPRSMPLPRSMAPPRAPASRAAAGMSPRRDGEIKNYA
jgi:hypothetical protein